MHEQAFLHYGEKIKMLILHEGRPKNEDGRLENEIKTYDLLDALKVKYQRLDHEPAMTMDVCGDINSSLHAMVCKNLFLCNRQETDFYLLMLPGEKRFKTKYLSAQLGVARLSFAGEEYMREFLGLAPGSVSVMGLMNDTDGRVQLVIDREVLEPEYLGCHPCINTSSIRLCTKDLTNIVLPALNHKPIIAELPNGEE